MLRSVLVFCALAFSSSASASNYPPGYDHQVVRLMHTGSAIFANVGSGMMSQQVLGYKNSGVLAQSNPQSIHAIITTTCMSGPTTSITQNTVVVLGREWNGTGYMSPAFYLSNALPAQCRYEQLSFKIVFSDGKGGWDPANGQDIVLGPNELRSLPVVYQTHESGTSINHKAWAFIVSEMTK